MPAPSPIQAPMFAERPPHHQLRTRPALFQRRRPSLPLSLAPPPSRRIRPKAYFFLLARAGLRRVAGLARLQLFKDLELGEIYLAQQFEGLVVGLRALVGHLG